MLRIYLEQSSIIILDNEFGSTDPYQSGGGGFKYMDEEVVAAFSMTPLI